MIDAMILFIALLIIIYNFGYNLSFYLEIVIK